MGDGARRVWNANTCTCRPLTLSTPYQTHPKQLMRPRNGEQKGRAHRRHQRAHGENLPIVRQRGGGRRCQSHERGYERGHLRRVCVFTCMLLTCYAARCWASCEGPEVHFELVVLFARWVWLLDVLVVCENVTWNGMRDMYGMICYPWLVFQNAATFFL